MILVFDSGLGGLTVWNAIQRERRAAPLVYLADCDRFPYGDRGDDEIIARCIDLVTEADRRFSLCLAVVACNTASTLVLPHLRERFAFPIVGTVPAIKPAAEASQSGLVSILATPGTVARDYTRGLIDRFAAGVSVTLVAAPRLAALAEAELGGTPPTDAVIWEEIAPAFAAEGSRRTDQIVLGCTHFPLLGSRIEALAPWPVTLVDPAPAIARRVLSVLPEQGSEAPGKASAGPSTNHSLFFSTAPTPRTVCLAASSQSSGEREIVLEPF
ncbi:MAG: glutamate racemase [Pseudomonadota bacterium]